MNAGGLFGCLLQAQRDRRDDGNAVLKGELLDGRGSELHAAAARAVGLRENEGDLVSRVNEVLERDGREVGRACKNDLHTFGLRRRWMGSVFKCQNTMMVLVYGTLGREAQREKRRGRTLLQRIQAGLPALWRLGCARRRADHGPWHVERRLADKPHRTPCAGRLSGHHARQPRLRGELPLHGHEGGRKKRGLSRGAGASAPKGDERLRA